MAERFALETDGSKQPVNNPNDHLQAPNQPNLSLVIPPAGLSPSSTPPRSPSFRMTLEKGKSPLAVDPESMMLMDSLREKFKDRGTRSGLRNASTHLPKSQTLSTLEGIFKEQDRVNENMSNENEEMAQIMQPRSVSKRTSCALPQNKHQV